MKYIRMKDRIYEVEEWFKSLENDMVYIPNEGLNKILNQADTIEELCDEFVAIDKETGHKDLVDYFDYNSLEKNEYYGAIWTEWGLKYVAKMNEKGELELK